MPRLATATLALIGVFMLAGCLPVPDPETPPTPSAPTPTATEAAVVGPIVLPDCEDLYTADQVMLLMGADFELIGDATNPESDGGFGTSILDLQSQLRDGSATNCTWVLPASERGLTVSFMVIDEAREGEIIALLDSAGAGDTPIGGDFAIHAFAGALDTGETAEGGEFPFTEAHAIGPEIWLCVFDGHGENAPALAQAALDVIIELNPGRF